MARAPSQSSRGRPASRGELPSRPSPFAVSQPYGTDFVPCREQSRDAGQGYGERAREARGDGARSRGRGEPADARGYGRVPELVRRRRGEEEEKRLEKKKKKKAMAVSSGRGMMPEDEQATLAILRASADVGQARQRCRAPRKNRASASSCSGRARDRRRDSGKRAAASATPRLRIGGPPVQTGTYCCGGGGGGAAAAGARAQPECGGGEKSSAGITGATSRTFASPPPSTSRAISPANRRRAGVVHRGRVLLARHAVLGGREVHATAHQLRPAHVRAVSSMAPCSRCASSCRARGCALAPASVAASAMTFDAAPPARNTVVDTTTESSGSTGAADDGLPRGHHRGAAHHDVHVFVRDGGVAAARPSKRSV